MDLSTGLGSPIGHCGQARNFTRLAVASEVHAERMAHGKSFTCPRGARSGPMEPAQCAAWWRANVAPCLSEAYGRCSIGAINDAKYPEDTMGNTNYGKCVECGRKGNRDSAGRCYHAACKAQRGKAKSGQVETTVTPADEVEEVAVSGQAQPFEKIEELEEADRTFQLTRALIASGAALVSAEEREHLVGQPAELPEDLDRPFVLDGIEFEPARRARPLGSRTVAIRGKHLSLHSGAIQEHGLTRYAYARLAASKDGQAIAIKFYTDKRPGASKIQRGCVIAAEVFLREHPGMVGKEAPLEAVGIEGWFVVRFGGEAA